MQSADQRGRRHSVDVLCSKVLQDSATQALYGSSWLRHMQVLVHLALLFVVVEAVACDLRLHADGQLTGFAPVVLYCAEIG